MWVSHKAKVFGNHDCSNYLQKVNGETEHTTYIGASFHIEKCVFVYKNVL